MNTIIDFMNTAFDFVIGLLITALSIISKAMLTHIHTTEWIIAMLMVAGAWFLIDKRRNASVGFTLLVLAVTAGAWLAWKTGHTGASVQQVTLAALSLHGLLRARGWALVVNKGYAK